MNVRRTAHFVICSMLILATMTGCVSLAANLIGVIQGNMRPADYEGLDDCRVAVICYAGTEGGSNAVSTVLTSFIHANLNNNLDDIDLVRSSKVQRLVEANEISEDTLLDIGQKVTADKVVAIELSNFSLMDGATLYRGQVDVSVTVYDLKDGGDVVYRRDVPEFIYPQHGGPSVTDTSESRFRGLFLEILADKISGLFHEVDPTVEFANDARSASL